MARNINDPNIESVPLWPKECSVSGCHEETASAMITVREPASPKTMTRVFSQVGYVKGFGEKQKFELRGNYIFVRWVARCAACYMAEAIKLKRQQLDLGESDKKFVDDHRTKLLKERQYARDD